MKQLFTAMICLLFVNLSLGQNCEKISPYKEGLVLEYVNYNKKGKEKSREYATTKSVTNNADGLSMTIELTSSEKDIPARTFVLRCKDGNFFIDMANYLGHQSEGQNFSLIEAEGDFAIFPSDVEAGKTLEDTTINLVGAQGAFNIPFTISSRKIEEVGTFKILAGEFDGYVVSFDYLFEMGPIKFRGKGKEWYVNGVGIVKSESYSKNGKLRWTRELAKMEQK